MDCVRATGMDKNTVYKWWNGEPVEPVKKKNPATPSKTAELSDKVEHFDWKSHLEKTWGVPMEEILKLVKDYEEGKITIEDTKKEEK